MTAVVDASVAVPAAIAGRWTARLESNKLCAPSLLWSEVAATLRQLEWRGQVSRAVVSDALAWLQIAELTPTPSSDLIVEARQLAADLGWAKTYDAEYVVLARRLGAPLVTIDLRLRRSVGSVIGLLEPSA